MISMCVCNSKLKNSSLIIIPAIAVEVQGIKLNLDKPVREVKIVDNELYVTLNPANDEIELKLTKVNNENHL